MDHEQNCAAAAAAIRAMAELVREVDPTAAVPTCPGWDVRRLVVHVGAIHRWATRMVEARAPERMARPEDDEPGDDLAGWLGAGAEGVAAMAAADPNDPMWAWGADRHVRFWPRRMLHETTVHAADVALAVDREPLIDAAVAADGIDELLENLPHAAYFAPGVTELRGAGSIHLHGTDLAGAEWMITLEPDGFRWQHDHGKGTVAVRGRTADLLLLAYGRRALADERFERFGDESLAARWLANAAL